MARERSPSVNLLPVGSDWCGLTWDFDAVPDLGPPLASEIGAIAERIGSKVAGPVAAEVDRDARFPAEAVEALRAERMLSVLVPMELGGAGASITQVAAAVEALGRHCASTAMVYAM